MVTIEYTPTIARIVGDLPSHTNEGLARALGWYDKNIQRTNYVNKNKSWYVQKDAFVSCYDKVNKQFCTGLITRAISVLRSHAVPFEYRRLYGRLEATPKDQPDWAFDHQRTAVKLILEKRRGIIQAPTGSGKTMIAAFTLEQFPEARGLVIVPTENLLELVHKVLENYLGEPVGKVSGKGKPTWKRVTVGMLKSLVVHTDEFKDELASIDIVIADEAHKAGSPESTKVRDALVNASVRIGLSATPERKDGSTIRLEEFFGQKLLVVPESEMIRLGVTQKPEVLIVRLRESKMRKDGKDISYNKGYERDIIYNDSRNAAIVKLTQEFLKLEQRGSAMLIADRLTHGAILSNLLERAKVQHLRVDGSDKPAYRQKVINSYKQGEFDCLVTSKIFDEGEDVPHLELLINAGGGAGERAPIQRLGRAQRIDKTGRKTRAIYIDFQEEDSCKAMQASSRLRTKYLKQRYADCVREVTLSEALKIISNRT